MKTIYYNISENTAVLLLLFLVLFISPIQGCMVRADSVQASATPEGTILPIYSCTPCSRGDYEVHVLHTYQPTGHSKKIGQPPVDVQTITINIETASPNVANIKLVLVCHEAAHWVINSEKNVHIESVLVMSRDPEFSTVSPPHRFPITTFNGFFSSMMNTKAMETFITDRFGFLSSYTAVFQTSSWNLTVGKCPRPSNISPSISSTRTTSSFWDRNFQDPTPPPYLQQSQIPGVISVILIGMICLILIIIVIARRTSSSRGGEELSYHPPSYESSTIASTGTSEQFILPVDNGESGRGTAGSAQPSTNPPVYEEVEGTSSLAEWNATPPPYHEAILGPVLYSHNDLPLRSTDV